MTKTRQENDMIDRIGLVYAKFEIELSEPIWTGVVREENKTEEQCDRLYRCDLW